MAGAPDKERHERAQDALSHMVNSLRELSLPPLGPDFVSLSGVPLRDALVVHRLSSKFITSIEDDDARAAISIQNMILQDNTGPTGALDWQALNERTRLNLIKAKHEIAKLLKGFKLPQVATRFPSGESCRTSGGEVAFAAKLSQDAQWTCGAGSLRYAAILCYNTPKLKKIVKERCKQLYPIGFFNDGVGGVETFIRMFSACVDIETARLATVPKDAEWDRVISMEPTFSMVAQLQLSKGLRKCLRKEWGYNIEERDHLHGLMLAWGDHYSTIDLKNASNSNWTTIVEALWPPHIVKMLKKFRSSEYSYETKGGEVKYFCPKMLSPMGNGFTFEVMTITLLAMVRCLDATGSVYGDDIIIGKRQEELLECLKATGWQINTSKTFLEGNFRESCGSFYDNTSKQYLLSYDLRRCEDDIDGIVATNKLYKLLQTQLGPEVRRILLKAYCELLCIYAAFATDPQDDLIESGVFSPFHADLPVNRKYDPLVYGMYHRRPRWRLACFVKSSHSKVPILEWCGVASRLLGQAERPPSKSKRRLYYKLIDEGCMLTHQELASVGNG